MRTITTVALGALLLGATSLPAQPPTEDGQPQANNDTDEQRRSGRESIRGDFDRRQDSDRWEDDRRDDDRWDEDGRRDDDLWDDDNRWDNRSVRQSDRGDNSRRWRYRRHNNEWWYWHPNDYWVYWRDGSWNRYSRDNYRLPRFDRGYAGYDRWDDRYDDPRWDGRRNYFDRGYYDYDGRRYGAGYRGWDDGWDDSIFRRGPTSPYYYEGERAPR